MMFHNGIYIPDLIAGDVLPSSSIPYSVGIRPTKFKEPGETETPATTPPTTTSSGSTATILLLGVITSVAGLAFEVYRYSQERKKA